MPRGQWEGMLAGPFPGAPPGWELPYPSGLTVSPAQGGEQEQGPRVPLDVGLWPRAGGQLVQAGGTEPTRKAGKGWRRHTNLWGLILTPINESKLIPCSRRLETQRTLGGIVLAYL